MIRAYLVDDEPPALDRLARMLDLTRRVQIVGSSTDPVEALQEVRALRPDILFLDIHMPGLSGFELLAELPVQPLVVFTTAYDQYALDAFRTNSIDYLLKPIDPEQLERALAKAERFEGQRWQDTEVRTLLARVDAMLEPKPNRAWLSRLASRLGDTVVVVDLRRVTHLLAREKLTFAVTADREYVVDLTIAELETRLDPARFVRIHRGFILNLDHLQELHADFGGRMVARLKDAGRTELPVSRERVRVLKGRLGL